MACCIVGSMRSYHLWVVPSGETYQLLSGVIVRLSEEYGSPRFAPHVTVLGHLPGSEADILARARQLAERLSPYQIELTVPGMTEHYFQCLFLHVAPTAAVLNAHAQAVTVFSSPDAAPYMPHLSLLYGSFPLDMKQGIIKALPASLQLSFMVDRLLVIQAESDDPKDWTPIMTIRLATPSTV